MAGKFGCTGTAHGGGPCNAHPIKGTDRCKRCCGTTLERQRAKGRLALTAREYGFNDEIAESMSVDDYMLRLTAGSFGQAKMYERLLAEAYDAAERLRAATGDTQTGLPPHADNDTDRDRAIDDLARVFNDGGIAALVGIKWGAAGKDGHLYQAEEAIRGLVDLWNGERDRAFRFAKDCRAAGLEDRRLELEHSQGLLVVEALTGALAELQGLLASGQIASLDPSQPAVARVLSTRLLALGAA